MTDIVASAPGKAILSGEYAVLMGGHAVVAAIDRRVQVRIAERAGRQHELVTRGALSGSWRFTSDEQGRLDWLGLVPRGPLALFESAWLHACPGAGPNLSITIDSTALCDPASGRKLGVGSSGAVAVALIGALAELNAKAADTLPATLHRAAQGGRGSGADVAASRAGGLQCFTMEAGSRRLDWPEQLASCFVWTGQTADTSARIARLGDAAGDSPEGKSLVNASIRCADAFAAADVERVLTAVREFRSSLEAFSRRRRLAVFAGGHDGLLQLGEQAGAVYKPCGAGGGDIGVALADNRDSIERFAAAATSSGFHVLEARIDEKGLVVESGARN